MSHDTLGFFLFNCLIKLCLTLFAPLLFKVVMQTTPIDMLNYEVYMMVSLKGLMELYDVLMIKFLHQHDLSTHRASTVLIDEL